jgi:hypothetical protein
MKITDGNWFEYHGKIFVQKHDPEAGKVLNFLIADCENQPHGRADTGRLPTEEVEANAVAIAQAPAALALLEEMSTRLDRYEVFSRKLAGDKETLLADLKELVVKGRGLVYAAAKKAS